MKAQALLKDAVTAVAAGYLATKAMEPVSMKLYELEPEEARRREDEVRPGRPFELAANNVLKRVVGIELDDQARSRAGMAFHYGAGISFVPAYMVFRRALGLAPATAGLATGAAMSLLLDEIVTPLIGASAPNRDYPLATHLRGFAAHLAYGLAAAAATETVWKLLRR